MTAAQQSAAIAPYRNLLLSLLPPGEVERIGSHLQPVSLAFKQRIYEPDQPIADVYFPESAVCSMICELADGTMVETGTIGYEGVTGVPTAMTGARSASLTMCQIPGAAYRLPVAVLVRELNERDSGLMAVVHRYLHYFTAMLAQGSACNRAHAVDARLARWLLMTHDRVDTDVFPLTQEFLGQMLGVQRPSVNIAAATLQRAGFIEYTRGRISVLNRLGLESAACDCYRYLAEQLERAIGRPLRATAAP